jgi:hypothetical protein
MDIHAQDDFGLVDGLENVTFTRRAPTGATVIYVQGALRRVTSRSDIQLLPPEIALMPTDLVWHLPVAALNGVKPTAGDVITAGIQDWVVLAAENSPLGGRWRLLTRLSRT